MSGAATQNTGYEGKLGHEKKFYKTHFHAMGKVWKSTPSRNVWVKVGLGRYVLVKNDKHNP